MPVLVGFFLALRSAGIPVTTPEFLALLAALKAGVAGTSAQDFYHLARACLVKDERHYDRFDRVFAEFFQGAEQALAQLLAREPPADWLRALGERLFSEDERRRIEALGSWEQLLETLRERLREQQERHEGGSKWIGTRGTSPFGSDGYNPQGVALGGRSRERRAVKVWERREFANLDESVELGTRNFKLALRRLRRFARTGAADQLDLGGTISATARNAGLLDLKLVPERRNAVKVLLLLDVGGSMDEHVRLCETLFAAARTEFRQLRQLYFHNCPYEHLWTDNRRRSATRVETAQLLRTLGRDWRVLVVGDASMSPYELTQPGGSIEHFNSESGSVWLQRLCAAFPHFVWLNPEPVDRWEWTASTRITRELIGERMFPLTLAGLGAAIDALKRAGGTQPTPPVGAGASGVTSGPPPG